MTTLRDIAVDQLHVDPLNPRRHIDEDDVVELAASIRDHGVDQPLQVRPNADGYGVLSGQQRLLAARQAGLMVVPCLVLEVDDTTAAVVAMTGNTGSRPMRPTDEGRGYQHLVDAGMTQSEVAQACGVAPSRVSNLLKLLTLDEDLVARVDAGKVGVGRAIETARRRYASGQGVPRGKAAKQARELGALGAVHLTGVAVARLLGHDNARAIGPLVRSGQLVRDEVSGGFPLHQVVALLDEERDTAADGGTVRISAAEAVRQALPGPVHARLEELSRQTGRPTAPLVCAAVESMLRRSRL